MHCCTTVFSFLVMSPKRRQFHDPRYVGEITMNDMSTSRRFKRNFALIKKLSEKKQKKIKALQDQNRYRVTAK